MIEFLWLLLSSYICISVNASLTVPNITELDCGARLLMLQQFSNHFSTWSHRIRDVHDALRLSALCGIPLPSLPRKRNRASDHLVADIRLCVDSRVGEEGDGSFVRPFRSIQAALRAAREIRVKYSSSLGRQQQIEIAICGSIYHLNETLVLTAEDSFLTFTSCNNNRSSSVGSGEVVWISGGVSLADAQWQASETTLGVWYTDLIHSHPSLKDIESIFSSSPHRRYTRARYPNADAEIDQWGYASANWSVFALPANVSLEWWRPKVGQRPEMVFIDLTDPSNPTGHTKNNSAQKEYNTWTVGRGGVCDLWRGDSYWCSNASAGGWGFVDAECADNGQLGIPIGISYNITHPRTANFAHWQNPKGGVVHVWASMFWFTNMFEISDFDAMNGWMSFSGGGQQGGRNWCRCDQCSGTGGFCRAENDTRLLSGSWYVENIFEELDMPSEWFFDADKQRLYVFSNDTNTTTTNVAPKSIPPSNLIAAQLQTLIELKGTQDQPVRGVQLINLGFRDTALTFLDEWQVPSGGDWAMHRGGAVSAEGVEDFTVSDCEFTRLDGNALLVAGYARNVTIQRNSFEWLGESAIAMWGDTKLWDATGGDQPRGTLISDNFIHDVGIYEKQSSGVAHAKSCQTTIYKNIMFNLPRAGINFNDNLGGNNSVFQNLLFNTCRETGDHGPVNSWDRLPFLNDLRGGEKLSFDALLTEVYENFIFANYGASQGFDTDDGSSFYSVHDNVFYRADGFKMDYGGHDSLFFNNLVVGMPYDGQSCYNFGAFVPGHGHQFFNNTCLVGAGPHMGSGCGDPSCITNVSVNNPDLVGSFTQCSGVVAAFHNNSYYSPDANTSIACYDDGQITI